MFRANITRDEANARSAQLHVESYEVVVDLTGRRPDGTPLADGAATFTSTTTVRFGSIACVTNANLIADELIAATLDGEPVPGRGLRRRAPDARAVRGRPRPRDHLGDALLPHR